jgi:L-ascorbate metabolism protein UlaG (beta-lactamase superfamily)
MFREQLPPKGQLFVLYLQSNLSFMKSFLLLLMFSSFIFSASAQLSAPDIIYTKLGPLNIQPVKHASLILTVHGLTVYVDPSGADNYKGQKQPDIILITDIHGDHFDIKTIEAVQKTGTLLVVPQVVADKLPAADKVRLLVMKNGDQTTQSFIMIRAIPMYNLPESPTAMHTKGRGNGYVLGIGGKLIYPEMRSLENIDVAFICMNLPYTMDVKEAADAVLAFKPRIVYPYHYRGKDGLSDVKEFKKLVEAGDKNIDVRLRNWYPGK